MYLFLGLEYESLNGMTITSSANPACILVLLSSDRGLNLPASAPASTNGNPSSINVFALPELLNDKVPWLSETLGRNRISSHDISKESFGSP